MMLGALESGVYMLGYYADSYSKVIGQYRKCHCRFLDFNQVMDIRADSSRDPPGWAVDHAVARLHTGEAKAELERKRGYKW